MIICFLKGLLLALVLAIPAGPVGALALQRSINYGFLRGFCTGLGAVAVDCLYAALSLLALNAISEVLLSLQLPLRIAGCILLFAFGIYVLLHRKQPIDQQVSTAQRSGLWSCFLSAFAISVTNPAIILSYTAALTVTGMQHLAYFTHNVGFLLGIGIGTTAWWLLLCGIAAKLRTRISSRVMGYLNLILGGLLVLFGVGILVTLFFNT